MLPMVFHESRPAKGGMPQTWVLRALCPENRRHAVRTRNREVSRKAAKHARFGVLGPNPARRWGNGEGAWPVGETWHGHPAHDPSRARRPCHKQESSALSAVKRFAPWREKMERAFWPENERCAARLFTVSGGTKFMRDCGEFPPQRTLYLKGAWSFHRQRDQGN